MFSYLLAAAASQVPVTDDTPWAALTAVFLAIVAFSIVVMIMKRYKRCPSNRVLVKYGWIPGGESAKCIHGGATFVLPIVQDYGYLSLEPLQIEIPLKGALSAENIRVSVPSVFTVAIGTEPAVMQNAAIRLLGLDYRQIQQQAQEIIFGQLRQVIASMRIEEINRDRETFLQHIQNSLEPELRKVGLVLINVNITDITDESGYIEAIGQKAASQAIQQARGDVAEQEKLGETRVAEADRDKTVQVATAQKFKQIGTREAQREQAVRIAELDKEQKIGEQTAGFEREAKVKDAERAMRIALAEANAKAVAGENTAQAAVVASQAELAVKQAEAYRFSEIKKREAEAAVQEAQNKAMAKAALAQAERIEAERRASLEAPAKAEKAKTIVEAEAEAERRRLQAIGEASAIYAKLEAEARGNYEVLAKKGEGLKQIIEACGGAEQAFKLLMLEHIDNLANTAATAISNIKFDKVVVWDGGGNGGNGSNATSNFLQSMARTLPPMMQVMKDVGGVEMPAYIAKFSPEGDKKDGDGKPAAPPVIKDVKPAKEKEAKS
jgi:flotillin